MYFRPTLDGQLRCHQKTCSLLKRLQNSTIVKNYNTNNQTETV